MISSALPAWFLNLPITSLPLLAGSYIVAGVLALILLLPLRRRGWWIWLAAAAIIGAVAGGATVWWVGDVQDTFDVSPTWVDRIWVGAVFAAVLVALVNLVLGRWWRRIVAVLAIVAVVLAGGLAINRDVGEFLTPGQLLGTNGFKRILLPKDTKLSPAARAIADAYDPFLYQTWKAPAGMPTTGRVGQVSIPGTLSHFPARDAMIYLPPAALVKHAPALPVVILMSGQPASPSSVFDAGHVPQSMDALAARNHGLAPIVVVPDQLGASENNPMCVNGALGNSATYILGDVPNWIRSHLHVETGRLAWTIGGFSQGATCSIQFATEHPETFGQFVDVAGQQYPTLANDLQAIDQGFRGSQAAFDAAKPATIMARHGRYDNLAAFFAYGEFDQRYRDNTVIMSTLAAKYGMSVTRYVSPGSAHDWTTATNGFARGIGAYYPRMGLAATPQTIPLQ